jgi:soluble lytic murein transglycosylase-like protein
VGVFSKLLTAILAISPAFAGEYAVLSSGLRLHLDHHENAADMLRLYTTKDGFVEVSPSMVTAFEEEDYVPPPPAPPKPAQVSAAVTAPAKVDPKAMVQAAATRYALPAAFVESVAKIESGMKTGAVSPKGAIGVMQLMPGTAQGLGADATDPEQNIDAGTRLLRELLLKYNGDVVKALAAYNAGSGAVDKYQGLPPYRETQSYVDKVIKDYKANGGQ